MTTVSTTLQADFPSKSYSKYRSQSRTNPLLNKFNNDTGYPQDILTPSSLSFSSSRRNYLNLNKQNLKNFFAERLPPRSAGIYRQSETIDPSRLFEIKRKQYQLKNQTKTTLSKTFDIQMEPFGPEPQKISQIFMVNDKNLDFKKKFLEEGAKVTSPYETINFRKGTDSCIRKYSKSIKKDAYNSVFGPEVSAETRKRFSQTQQQNFLTTRPISIEIGKKGKSSGRRKGYLSKQQKRKFSSMIGKVDQNRIKFDPDNKMGIKPYCPPQEQDEREGQKNLMLTWIKDVAQGYKNQSINLNMKKIETVSDLNQMDENYYNDMIKHKRKRLQIRQLQIWKGRQIRNLGDSQLSSQSGLHLVQQILDGIDDNNKINDNLSISGQEQDSQISSDGEIEELTFTKKYLNIRQRFQAFGTQLVHTLYQAKFYGITNKVNIYNAFWKNPFPYEISGCYAFFKAIKKGDLEGVKKFMEANIEFLYERDHKGRSPLIYACVNNQLELVQFFLTQEIDVNKKCFRRKIALYYALENQNQAIVECLLKGGSEVWSTEHCSLKEVLPNNQNNKIYRLVKNARIVNIAMSLKANRIMKLQFWRENKWRINPDTLIKFT